MLPQTPFQQFLAPRIATVRRRLGEMIWHVEADVTEIKQSQPTHEHRPVTDVAESSFNLIDNLPMTWGRKHQQCWWHVKLPAFEGRRWLRWDDEGEATLYRRDGDGDGTWTPHHGIDPGHLQAPLPDDATELLVESICCRSGVWVHGESQGLSHEGSQFRGAKLLSRDEGAWRAWHDFDVLIGLCALLYKRTLPRPYGPNAGNDIGMSGGELFGAGGYRSPIESAPPLLRKILRGLTAAADAFDREGPAAAADVSTALLADLPAADHEIKGIITGHAHIDLAWLWPERVGDFKAVHSFATADALMSEYPDMHFGYSQPASYEAVERRSPSLLERVKTRCKDRGRWEPTGAMYVESDTQLPCGEALVRAIEIGQEGFADLSGEESRVLWLPDVFGYSAVMPQLLSGFDVPYFFTTKMHWSAATRFPHSAFRWQSNDGSEVLGFIAWEHYNLAATPRELDWASTNQRQSDVFPETLVCVGYGDGGGGVNATMCERINRMADLAELPRCEWGRIDSFFDRMSEVTSDLPTWRGEMYLEYHRGVQTTHVHLKQAYRAAERALQVAEAVRCATGGGPVDVHDWKRVCWTQFHDVLPGSSIQEVYQEIVPELHGITDRLLTQAASELGGDGEACVFNPIACERVEVIDGRAVLLPPLAGVALNELEAVDAAVVMRDGKTLDNGRVRVTFDDDGHVASLWVDGEAVELAGRACGLLSFADVPANYDAWEVERYTLSLGVEEARPADLSWTGDDARQELAVTRPVGSKSTATTRFILEAASAVLRVEVDLDLQDEQTLIKLTVPTKYDAADAVYGGPFGSVTRGQSGNTVADDARFEVPASRWMCVGDAGGAGVMLLTEATYGAGCRDGLLHVSLARSALITRHDQDLHLRDFDAYGEGGYQKCSDIGKHTIKLAIGRFNPAAKRREQPAQLADLLFTPAIAYTGKPVSAGLERLEDMPSVAAAWAKPEADGWTLRLHETLGRRGSIRPRLTSATMTRVDLRGEPSGDTENATIVKPHDLVSLRMVRCS